MKLTDQKKLEILERQGKYQEVFKKTVSQYGIDKTAVKDIVGQKQIDNKKLFRRWITAQTFHLLDGPDGLSIENWERGLGDYSYNYQLSMLEEELRVLSILQKKDGVAFKERKCFFNQDTAIALCLDALNYTGNKDARKVYNKLARVDGDYTEIYKLFKEFRKEVGSDVHHLHKPKCNVWLTAYKNAGAYETIKNLVLFHGCKFNGEDGEDALEKMAFLAYSEAVNDWQGVLFKIIEENNFDYKKAW